MQTLAIRLRRVLVGMLMAHRPQASAKLIGVPVTFNHTIVAARDRQASATFLADLLGLPEPTSWGPFTSVELDAGVFLQYAEPPVEEIQMQHYAFLVDDE